MVRCATHGDFMERMDSIDDATFATQEQLNSMEEATASHTLKGWT